MLSNPPKHFFGYFNTLETYSEMGLNKKKVIISQSLDDWAYLLWVDKAEKVHPREKPLLLLLPAFDKSLVALDGEEAPLVEVGGGPPPWVDTDQ